MCRCLAEVPRQPDLKLTARIKESAMNTQIRYGAYSLLGASIVLALLLAYPELNRSKAKEPAVSVVGMWDDTETFTPPPDGLQTWYVFHEWHNDRWNCSKFHPTSGSGPAPDVPAAQVLVGYINHYEAGSGPLPCEENSKDAYRGTIWFDLSKLSGKLPVAATATLNFKQVAGGVAAYDAGRNPITKVCDDRLFLANVDWRKGWESKGAVPEGELVSAVHGCAEGCNIDVTDIVNKWTTGAANNYGFVIVGENEDWLDKLIPNDNSVCETRYGDFTLTIKLKKASPIHLPTPKPTKIDRPGPGGDKTALACTNVALASNGAVATAQNYTKDGVFPALHFDPSYAIDGVRHTTTDGGNYWRDEHGLPSWLQVKFKNRLTTINEITVVTLQDPGYEKASDPTDTQTFVNQGATAFDVQFFNGTDWSTVPGGSITGNNLVVRRISFTPITTSMIRVVVNDTSEPKVARIVEVEACNTAGVLPQKSPGEQSFGSRTDTAFGLITTTFDTLNGTVSVNLPDDVGAGDTISGTVITEPKGNTRDEQAKNEDSLNGYVVEVAKQETPTQEKEGSKWVIPPIAQFIPVVLKNQEGKVVGRAEVPLGTVVKPKPNGDQGNYSTPPFGQAGRPISVAGPFDGDFNNTAVNLGNNTAQFLAESPRKVVVRSPANVVGPATIEVNEQGKVVARCNYQSIGVKLAAGKLNLIRGEQTTVTVTLSGLDGATGPVPIQLTNASPATVSMEGGDTQTIIAQPGEFTGGVFTAKRTLTGIKPGGFAINAVVNPSIGTKGAGGVWKTCGRGAPGPENRNNLLGFYSEQYDLQNGRHQSAAAGLRHFLAWNTDFFRLFSDQ
jgi:hypothetical protein